MSMYERIIEDKEDKDLEKIMSKNLGDTIWDVLLASF